MSATLDSMYVRVQNGQVPGNWEAVSFLSLKPLGAWFEDMIERVEFMRKWLLEGTPSSFWLSGFFFPQGFMTGCLQTHARQYTIAIDRLSFSFEVLQIEDPEEIEEPPVDGIYVYGLYMDGCKWNADEMVIDD